MNFASIKAAAQQQALRVVPLARKLAAPTTSAERVCYATIGAMACFTLVVGVVPAALICGGAALVGKAKREV